MITSSAGKVSICGNKILIMAELDNIIYCLAKEGWTKGEIYSIVDQVYKDTKDSLHKMDKGE